MERVEKTVFIRYRRTNIPWALAIFQNLTRNVALGAACNAPVVEGDGIARLDPDGLAVIPERVQHGFDVFFDYSGIASGDFERVLLENIKPDFALAFYNRNLARRAKGDLEGALKDYSEAIRLGYKPKT